MITSFPTSFQAEAFPLSRPVTEVTEDVVKGTIYAYIDASDMDIKKVIDYRARTFNDPMMKLTLFAYQHYRANDTMVIDYYSDIASNILD